MSTRSRKPALRLDTLLPGDAAADRPSRRRLLGVSLGVHGALLAGLWLLPDSPPHETERRVEISFYRPERVTPPPAPPVARSEPQRIPEPAPEPERPAPPLPEPTPAARTPEPTPEPPTPKTRKTPPPAPKPPSPPTEPPRPEVRTRVFANDEASVAASTPSRREVRSVSFGEKSPAPDTPPRERRTVDTSGFRTETAVAPAPREANRIVADGGFTQEAAVQVATLRSRDVTRVTLDEAAEPRSDAAPASRGTVTEAGFGETSTDEVVTVTSRPRVVATAAFDLSTLEGTPAQGDVSIAVQRGGFGSGVAERRPTRTRELPGEAPDAPVEVVSKPRPVYTEQARELRVEGEVLLEVTFVADGKIRVLRVVEGLGHGLDEAAMDAAQKIQFTPARRDGQPVDHTATLRVVFRLA